MRITSRMPRDEYDAINAINMSRLKEIKRSPQHYKHALTNPKSSDAMTLGTAAHVAVLEPERYASQFVCWSRRTASGNSAPRNGQFWDAFQLENRGKTILTYEQDGIAKQIAAAVRADEIAMKYLSAGDPEVTLEWDVFERPAKGRVDWLTTRDGAPMIVGLKTSRDCRHFAFGAQAAKLGYHLQWAWYHDGFEKITGKSPHMVEIVVEADAPHAVATYIIPGDIIDQGRDEYQRLLEVLTDCEDKNLWPGPVPLEEVLTLPSWVYGAAADDLSDLGLEAVA